MGFISKKGKPLEITLVLRKVDPSECKVIGGIPARIDGQDVCIFVKGAENREIKVETVGESKRKVEQ